MSRRNERFKLIASFHASAAAATLAVGFVRPELDTHTVTDESRIYDLYLSLFAALLILAFGLGWLQLFDDGPAPS